MAKRPYEFLEDTKSDTLLRFCQDIARTREEDIEDFNNLTNTFMRGRKVGKIPTGSSDVASADRIGDFNYDADYLYICVDDSGAAWRRITLGSW
jgi:hypothetical protein